MNNDFTYKFTTISIDEEGFMILGNDNKKIIQLFVDKPYTYDTYNYSYDVVQSILKLIEDGLLHGHSVHVHANGELRGYIGVTEAGRMYLDFKEL